MENFVSVELKIDGRVVHSMGIIVIDENFDEFRRKHLDLPIENTIETLKWFNSSEGKEAMKQEDEWRQGL